MSYAFDPELVPLLEMLPPVEMADPLPAREEFAAMSLQMNAELDTSGVRIEDRNVPGPEDGGEVPVRIYTPEGLAQPVPGLIYLHGGGFVLGGLESEHGICINLCRSLGIVVISVDYRLSPETPYPGALEDCYAVLLWAAADAAALQVDSARIGIAGQSAGGCLAAATALLTRDRQGPPLCFQFLGIPVLDDRMTSPSMRQFTDTPVWDRGKSEISWAHYLGDAYTAGAEDVPIYAAPARCEDLTGLPSAYISTMEFDPLRDEALDYGCRLLQARVATEIHNYPGTFHGASLFAHTTIAQRETADMLAALRAGLKVDA